MAVQKVQQVLNAINMPKSWLVALSALFISLRESIAPVQQMLTGSATYDAANLVDGAGVTTTVAVTGAAVGDYVVGVSFGVDLQGLSVTAYVSATNTVSVRIQNETGGAIDLASTTVRAVVMKQSSLGNQANLQA